MTEWRDIDIHVIATRGRTDWGLEQLLDYADACIGFLVALLVGGFTLQGAQGSAASWGERLDQAVAETVDSAEAHFRDEAKGGAPEHVAEAFKRIRGPGSLTMSSTVRLPVGRRWNRRWRRSAMLPTST